MNKFEFIKDLLQTKKLNSKQRERIINLAADELSNTFPLEDRVKRIEDLLMEENMIKANPATTKSFEAFHKPLEISKYLNKFKENTDLKWTTHLWDNKKYETIDDFITSINNDKEYQSLFNKNRDLYNLINYFIYHPTPEFNEYKVPQYGWPFLNEMKVGWQFPKDLLISWSRENFDNKDDVEIKTPFQYVIPKKLRPKKLIGGKEIKTFEDVVNVFKTEIQFRENYLYDELSKWKYKMTDFQFVGLESFKMLDFYTYTRGVLSAIDKMLDQIKKNETANKIEFTYKFLENHLIVDITQINSFPTRSLNINNPKQFLGGGLNAIASSLFSLADFSIISNFNDNNTPGEINITDQGSHGEMKGKHLSILTPPTFTRLNKRHEGFTYRMKFYI